VAVFGYFYSVRPIATKARLEERNAELESSIRATEYKLKLVSRETYQYVIKQYVRRVASAASFEVGFLKVGIGAQYYVAQDSQKVFPWLRASDGPWDDFLSLEDQAQISADHKVERSLTGKDLLEANLDLPEIRLLSSEDAALFKSVVSEFIRSSSYSEILSHKIMRQVLVKPDMTIEELRSDEYRKAVSAESDRLNSVHKQLAIAVGKLRDVLSSVN
jgi:hypothetical protein